jgi:hypothetical protein
MLAQLLGFFQRQYGPDVLGLHLPQSQALVATVSTNCDGVTDSSSSGVCVLPAPSGSVLEDILKFCFELESSQFLLTIQLEFPTLFRKALQN